MSEDPRANDPMRAVAVVSQLGFAAGMPVVVGALLGYAAEQRYPAGGIWLMVGIAAGVASGVFAAYRLLLPFLGKSNGKK